MNSEKNRIEWIDLAKGMSIILVVYGHSWLSNIPFFGDFFASIRMPFFFFCSGLLFNYNKFPSLVFLIKRRYRTLVRPFFYFSLIVLLLEFYVQDNWLFFVKNTLMYGWGGYALWFIPVLAATELWFYLINKISNGKDVYTVLVMIISAMLGYLTYYYRVPNYYNICFVLTSVIFYGAGNILSSHIISFFRNQPIWKILVAAVIFFITTLSFLFNQTRPDFGANYLVGPATYSAGLSGALMMCCIAVFISRLTFTPIRYIKHVIVFMGMNSYVILAFHQIILLLLGKYTNLSGVVERLVMWAILVFLILAINRYFPSLLGRNKEYITK